MSHLLLKPSYLFSLTVRKNTPCFLFSSLLDGQSQAVPTKTSLSQRDVLMVHFGAGCQTMKFGRGQQLGTRSNKWDENFVPFARMQFDQMFAERKRFHAWMQSESPLFAPAVLSWKVDEGSRRTSSVQRFVGHASSTLCKRNRSFLFAVVFDALRRVESTRPSLLFEPENLLVLNGVLVHGRDSRPASLIVDPTKVLYQGHLGAEFVFKKDRDS